MTCISPIYIPSRREWVPCGKCNFCLKTRRAGWAFRLHQQLKVSSSADFITLTYAPEFVTQEISTHLYNLEPSHVTDFMRKVRKVDSKIRGQKKWKKNRRTKSTSRIKYYTVGEYGELLFRPHYHIIMFNLHPTLLPRLQEIWGKGTVHRGNVEMASIHYVTGYVINNQMVSEDVRTFPFARMSKGLGINYCTPQMVRHHKRTKQNFVRSNGVVGPLPRYFKEKIFTKLERKIMALEAVAFADKQYCSQVEKIARHNANPYTIHEIALSQAHDRIRQKQTINQL